VSIEDAMATRSLATQYAAADERPLNLTEYAGSNQVNIRVRFAEVSKSEITRLGINWQALATVGDFTLGLTTGNFLPGAGLNAAETFGTIIGGYAASDVSVDLLLDALQREGVVSILAEPNLTSVSGRTASFLAGGEFPVPVPQSDDVITIQYKRFGVALDFTPTVLPHERIAIEVQPEVSSLTSTNAVVIDDIEIPALTVRRADATVELASGQTFAIAGLFQRNLTQGTDQLPLLGDIPVLGELFRSRRFQREETELVILITPYLVKPTQERELALAGEAPAGGLPALTPEAQSFTHGAAGFLLE
jgi:pilus assembly protein CpaC